MAQKHIVKCLYCGEQFDAQPEDENKIWVKPNARRYAHLECHTKAMSEKTQEDIDLENIYAKVKELEGVNYNYIRTKKVLENMVKKFQYTYSSILKTLIYFYDVKKNKPKEGTGALGIVPYVYNDAYNYYYSIYLAQLKADKKIVEKYKVIEIESPRAKITPVKLFDMDFEEEEDINIE